MTKLNYTITKSIPIYSKSVNPYQSKLLLLIDSFNQAYVYPDTVSNKLVMGRVLSKLVICNVDKESGIITGMRVNPQTLKGVEVWRLNFQQSEEQIVSYASDDQLSDDEYQGIEENDGNILYKYIDPNLLAVATFSAPNHLNVYIINRSNGTIIYSGHVYNAYGKDNVKISFTENRILVSYLKKYVFSINSYNPE